VFDPVAQQTADLAGKRCLPIAPVPGPGTPRDGPRGRGAWNAPTCGSCAFWWGTGSSQMGV